MNQEIQAIRFDVQEIGKHVKSSKKRFSWTFGLNNRNHTIILDFSFISGKVKLVVDRKTMLETELPANSSFQHPFTLDGYAINILQQGQSFQLRINNKVFSHIYNQAKTNTQFKNYEDQVKDIKVSQNAFQNTGKTLKLNIGAFDGAKKKTKTAVQSENWGNFGGNQMGIPSYFGDSSPSKTQKKTTQINKKESLLDQQEQTTSSSVYKKVEKAPHKKQEVDFFAQSPKQQPSVSVSPTQQQIFNILSQNQPKNNKDDFNTMQNMFATMNLNNPVQAPKKQSSLDLLNNSATNVNINDFNTMQKLFATNLQTPPTSANLSVNFQGISQIPDLNTIQNLFSTNSGNLGATSQPIQPIINPSIPNAANYQTGNANNFYSVGNLYATNQGISLAQMQSSQVAQPNVNQNSSPSFNTMQNFFATTNNSVPQNLSNFNLNQPNSNIENINLNDFNTMQNLFKTNGVNLAQSPISASTTIKKEDPFSLLGISQGTKLDTSVKTTTTSSGNLNAGMFNTYSGNKSATGGFVDASSFGTMQKGQPSNIDFFQNLPTQPKQQVPNFSKKKQPVQQDLI